MTAKDYSQVYDLWINTKGMGLNERKDLIYRNKAISELTRIDT